MKVKNGQMRLLGASLLGMVLLPIVNYGILDYIQQYINGDIQREGFFNVISYIIEAISFALPYVTFALVICAMLTAEGKRKIPYIVMGYFSLFCPYLARMTVQGLLAANFGRLFWYYFFYALLNYALDAVILTVVLLCMLYLKKKKAADALKKGILCAVLLLLLLGLAQEIYMTVSFFYELKYEYYASMTKNELISLITGYLMLAVKAGAGYAIMRLTTAFCIAEQPVPDIENAQ